MTYKKALELKKAGYEFKDFEDCEIGNCWENKHSHCFPTLEELIDECGEDFEELSYPANKEWFASAKTNKIKDCCKKCGTRTVMPITKSGKTKKEAVANLYIALNKK